MKLKNSFFYTLREDVKDEDSTSGNLLVKAGFIKKSASGVYMFMPLGLKVKRNIEAIVRDEMNKTGSQEMTMPTLIQEDVYIASGRRDIIGQNMFALKDRYDKPYVLGPTHEELFAQAAQMKIRSYRDMPFSLYQFQTKFRDETRPRYGLIRVREFVMKDAYSFDVDEASGDLIYNKMVQAYKNIFDRLGMNYRIVRADTGIMGGLLSEEFQAITPIGEDTVVLGEDTGFASNIEVAENCARIVSDATPLPIEKVHTPNAKTIEQVASFLGQDANTFVKSMLYQCDDQVVLVCVSGTRDINEVKLGKLLKAADVALAEPHVIQDVLGCSAGFVGPKGVTDIPVIFDFEIEGLKNFTIGALEDDYHYINANFSDLGDVTFADVTNVREGDPNPEGKGVLTFSKGIEVGNTFKLGTDYSVAMGLEYLDQNQKLQKVFMGSYGIGIARTMAALVEQNNDERGIKWPMSITPFHVGAVVINVKNEAQVAFGNQLYDTLTQVGIEVLLDDRDQRPGVKFNDMELIGLPYQITIGRDIDQGLVEFKARGAEASESLTLEAVKARLLDAISA